MLHHCSSALLLLLLEGEKEERRKFESEEIRYDKVSEDVYFSYNQLLIINVTSLTKCFKFFPSFFLFLSCNKGIYEEGTEENEEENEEEENDDEESQEHGQAHDC